MTEFQSQPELIQGWREKNKMVKTGKHKEREAKMDRGGFFNEVEEKSGQRTMEDELDAETKNKLI